MCGHAWPRSTSVLLVFVFLALAPGGCASGDARKAYRSEIVGAWGNSMYTFEFRPEGTVSYTLTTAGQEATKTGTYEVVAVQVKGWPESVLDFLIVSIQIADSDKGKQMATID